MRIAIEVQSHIIENIRNGNVVDREEYILYYYERVKKIIKKLGIAEQFQEDLQQECMEEIIILIDNYDFTSKKSSISTTIYDKIFQKIYDYLINEYQYEIYLNGKKYINPKGYLYAKNGYSPSYVEGLNELLKNGKVKEDEVIYEDITSDSYLEDILSNDIIRVKYYEYLKSLNSTRLESIMLGRFPVNAEDFKSLQELAKEFQVTHQRIEYLEKKIRYRMRFDFLEYFDWPEDSHNYELVKLRKRNS